MATGTGCAYILDIWADDPQQPSNMVDGLLRTPPTENSIILLLAGVSSKQPDTVKTALAAQHLERVMTFENEDKMAVFYKAKLYLDKHNISVLFMLCSNKCSRYWHLILSSMLTNVYEWTIKAVDQAEAEIPPEEQVTNDVTSFFGSLSTFGDIITLKSPIIPSDLFFHGFSCRTGGLSHLPGMKSLNLVFSHAKRDSKILVSENRRKLANHVGFNPEKFFVARAVHGNYVHVVGKTEAEGFDGIVTDQPGITIGAPGADCVTLVFADPVKRACAALHSGWKGTVKRACVEVLRTMTKEFGSNPRDVIVAMGPSIGQCCFEFDVDQSGQFTDIVAEAVEVRDGGNKAYVNLQLCNRVLLEQNGVKPNNIDDATCTKCTSCNSDLFFSYRRDGRPFGNQLGFIGIAIKDAPPPTEHK
ncbi:purine nucleoside phosphorylase LACC1-like [Argopecten irradians]|uniref:purine nucleoside phosphorylase LACC1-like n=1 Tax=Argopecten irradians TaxID=31199 RepID=UPI00371FB897